MKKRVIITNDGSTALKKLVLDLERSGFEVKLVESDGEKLERVIENIVPDILIADAFMKNLDALDVLSSIGGKLKEYGVKIFIMTALKNKFYERKLLSKGADAYLIKPVKLNSIIGKRATATRKTERVALRLKQAGIV